MLERYGLSLEDKLRTFYEHAAFQIFRIINANPSSAGNGKLLITGGGAFNKFLVERIEALCPCQIVIPGRQIIEYKEALIFAFLGALYMADEPGCLAIRHRSVDRQYRRNVIQSIKNHETYERFRQPLGNHFQRVPA